MPTFKRIPEFVDARKFEGGMTNGLALTLWIDSNGGKSEWVEEHVAWRYGNREGVASEEVRLFAGPYLAKSTSCFVGDWIMRRQDGRFEVVRQQVLDSEFEQV